MVAVCSWKSHCLFLCLSPFVDWSAVDKDDKNGRWETWKEKERILRKWVDKGYVTYVFVDVFGSHHVIFFPCSVSHNHRLHALVAAGNGDEFMTTTDLQEGTLGAHAEGACGGLTAHY